MAEPSMVRIEDQRARAVNRALDLLVAFSESRRALTVTQLATIVGLHKSTVSRLAAALVERGFLERSPNGFRLGHELARLGSLALDGRALREVARLELDILAEETGETVNLCVRDGDEVFAIAQAEGRHLVGAGFWPGRRAKLHCSAVGKVLLAFGEDNELPSGPLEPCTQASITDPDILRAELAEVRGRGWATAVGELEEGLHSVAVPVFDSTGRCCASVAVSAPAYRLPPEQFTAIADRCAAAASRISARLGA